MGVLYNNLAQHRKWSIFSLNLPFAAHPKKKKINQPDEWSSYKRKYAGVLNAELFMAWETEVAQKAELSVSLP